MNRHCAASFLGVLKIAEGNECSQDEYVQISDAAKTGMQIDTSRVEESKLE